MFQSIDHLALEEHAQVREIEGVERLAGLVSARLGNKDQPKIRAHVGSDEVVGPGEEVAARNPASSECLRLAVVDETVPELVHAASGGAADLQEGLGGGANNVWLCDFAGLLDIGVFASDGVQDDSRSGGKGNIGVDASVQVREGVDGDKYVIGSVLLGLGQYNRLSGNASNDILHNIST